MSVRCSDGQVLTLSGVPFEGSALLQNMFISSAAASHCVDVPRDSENVKLVLQFLRTGHIPASLYTDQIVAQEFLYWGVAPAHSDITSKYLQPFNMKVFRTEAMDMIERVMSIGGDAKMFETSVLLPSVKYNNHEHPADVYRYTEVHPELFRAVAFTVFGLEATWQTYETTVTTRYHDRGIEEYNQLVAANEVVYTAHDWHFYTLCTRDPKDWVKTAQPLAGGFYGEDWPVWNACSFEFMGSGLTFSVTVARAFCDELLHVTTTVTDSNGPCNVPLEMFYFILPESNSSDLWQKIQQCDISEIVEYEEYEECAQKSFESYDCVRKSAINQYSVRLSISTPTPRRFAMVVYHAAERNVMSVTGLQSFAQEGFEPHMRVCKLQLRRSMGLDMHMNTC